MTSKVRLQVEAPNDNSYQGTATVRSRNIDFQVEQAVARTTNWLLSAQSQDGYWWAELEADTTLESDYILYLHILGQLESEKTAKLAGMLGVDSLCRSGHEELLKPFIPETSDH